MSRHEYECLTCGETHPNLDRAARCCDDLMNDLDDEE